MSLDFRTTQIQTSKIIASSSIGAHRLLIYSVDADGTPANQGNINTSLFSTGSIGSDVFFFVSGSETKRSVFGGTVFLSGNVTVAENKKLQATTIETITPTFEDNRPNFSGVGVALGGWDSTDARSGSLVIRNHNDLWVPAVSYAAQHLYNYTDLNLSDFSALTTVRGLHINLFALGTVNLLPGNGYGVYVALTGSNSQLVVGNNDNGTPNVAPFTDNVIRAPSWYVDGTTISKPAAPLKLFSGLGIGNGTDGYVEIAAGKKNPTLTSGHTYSTVARFHGDNRLQLFGTASLDGYSLDLNSTGSIVYNTLSGTLNVVDDTAVWRALPKLNFFHLASYQSTNVLSSSAQILSQFYFDKTEIGGSVYKLRLVYSVTSSSIAGRVKLYDVTGGSYVLLNDLDDFLEISTTTPTIGLSTELNLNDFGGLYELEMFSTNTGSYIVLGDAKIIYY